MEKVRTLITAIIVLIGLSMTIYAMVYVPLTYGIKDILLTKPTRFEGSAFPDYAYPGWAGLFFFGIVFIILAFLLNVEKIANRIAIS